jgi:hypothetical protein
LTAASSADIAVEASLGAALALIQVTESFFIREGSHGTSDFGEGALGAVESFRTNFTSLSESSGLGSSSESETDIAFRTGLTRLGSGARVFTSTTTSASLLHVPVSSHARAKVTGRAWDFFDRCFRAVSSVHTLGVNICLVTGAEISFWTVSFYGAHGSTECTGRTSVRLASAVRAHVTSFTRLGIDRSRRAEGPFSAIPALFITTSRIVRHPGRVSDLVAIVVVVDSTVETSSRVSKGSSRAFDRSSLLLFLITEMTDRALMALIIADTTVVTVRSLGAGEAVSSLPFTFIRVIRSLEAWSRLRRFLRAEMTLGTDSHHTVIRDAVITSYTRLTPADVSGSLDTVVISLRTSGRKLSCLVAVVTYWANLSGITSQLGAEITEVTSITVSLDKSTITELSVRAEEALFRGSHSFSSWVGVEPSSALSR